MMGRIVGKVLNRGTERAKEKHPVAGALIGAGTLLAARRLLPQRYAILAATVAAGYLTRKWAARSAARAAEADTPETPPPAR